MSEPDIDLVITIAHIALMENVNPDLTLAIYKKIRELKPRTPIIQLAGHTHSNRNTSAVQPSEMSGSWRTPYISPLNSTTPGYYGMETTNQFKTIGYLQFKLGEMKDQNNTSIIGTQIKSLTQSWIVTNREQMASFVDRTLVPDTFSTPIGTAMKSQLKQWARDYGLSTVWACWNKTTLEQYGTTPHPQYELNNIYLWWNQEVLPTYFDPTAKNIQYFITSSASLRAWLNQGQVAEEDIFNILPFQDDNMVFYNLTAFQFQEALYHTQAQTFGYVSIKKQTECVHDDDQQSQHPDVRVVKTTSGTHVMKIEAADGQQGGHAMKPRQLPQGSTSQDRVFRTPHPFSYYGTKLPVIQPVPAMYNRTWFTFADIAAGFDTTNTASDYIKDRNAYNFAKNRADQLAIRNAFLEQYGNQTFDLITPRYFAEKLFGGKIPGTVFGYPNGTSAIPVIYPGNPIAYPGAPINATHLLRTFLFNNYKCNFTTPYTPPVD